MLRPQHIHAPCYLCKAPAPDGGWAPANVVGAGCTRPPVVCAVCSARASQNAAKIPRADRVAFQARLQARGVHPDLQLRAVLVACWRGSVWF